MAPERQPWPPDEDAVAVPPGDRQGDGVLPGNVLWAINLVWSIAILVLLLASGLSATLRDWSQRAGRRWFFTLVIYYLLFNIITTVADLPRAIPRVRRSTYGCRTRPSVKWWETHSNRSRSAASSPRWCCGCPCLLLRTSPRRWWLYHRAGADSVHHRRQPRGARLDRAALQQVRTDARQALEARILALADRAGIEGGRVFEVNKSVDTKTLNAYVTGVFSTKRIVLWDTSSRG
jgi:hypothetical protein